jgi:cell division protein FtsI/penicillin-binding protein 2
MATVAAAVDAGQWHAPRLLIAPSTLAPTGPPPAPLGPDVVANLRSLMRLVVTSGTGTAANVPGQVVFGKTGTAEFGSGTPPETHAWFIGFRGDLAFAIIVEGGGVGGTVAAPLAARFVAAAP